jgi:curved DNA-binding protein CbpA
LRPADLEQDHYKILGLEPDATPEQIKARFRELARKYHPDAARTGPDSSRMFAKITVAYRTLSDPGRRKEYDLERKLAQKKAKEADRESALWPDAGVRASRLKTGPRKAPGRGAERSDAARRARPSFRGTGALLSDAEIALARGRYNETKEMCQRILRYDRSNLRAHVLMGDAYRAQGNADDAIAEYTIALQLDPRNKMLQRRLEKAARARRTPARHSVSGIDRLAKGGHLSRGERARGIGSLVAFVGAVFVPLFALGNEGRVVFPGIALVSTWSDRLILAMVADGFGLALVLSLLGAIGRIDDELLLDQSYALAKRQRGVPPVGLIYVLFGGLFFYLSLFCYLAVGVAQDSLSRSLGMIYGATMVLLLIFALAYTQGTPQVALLGGNVIFLAMIGGWFIGDIFRPDW